MSETSDKMNKIMFVKLEYSYENPAMRERAECLINNEVYICQSSLVDELLKQEVFKYDDILNLYAGDEEKPDIENEEKDIYEWYAISERLADDLKELNYPVLVNDYGQWMGRTTTNQSIILDGIIYQVLELIDKRVLEITKEVKPLT